VFAVVIDGVVFADGEKPGSDAVGIEGGEGGGELDEGVLHDVASVFEAGREGEGVADERSLVAVQEGFKGGEAVAHAGQVHRASRVGEEVSWGAAHFFLPISVFGCQNALSFLHLTLW
jgi:hypothetical protein